MINIIYNDKNIVVAIKPSGVLSTDEPDGMPELIKNELKDSSEIKSVHRLDRVVSGLMVYAKNTYAASNLSKQIQNDVFDKSYLAVVHGIPIEKSGRFDDLLFRDKTKNMSYVVKRMRKGVKDAALEYEVIDSSDDLSLIKIHLITGRTHQIRAQFSSRKLILVGDKKYGAADDHCQIALWSYMLKFINPGDCSEMHFEELPPNIYPWSMFKDWNTFRPPEEYELKERKAFREKQI